MIEAKGLTKRYGAFRALDKVSFEVKRGEVVGFIGPNGAGKSTTMRILTCYLSATQGSAKVDNHDVFDEPLKVRESIGYLPQRANMYGDMGVLEYLRFAAELRGIDDATFKKRMKEVVEVCGLGNVLGKDIRTLSHGFRQRVGLGQALLHNPPVLILDEPTSDLDPNERAEVIEYIRRVGKDRTIMLSTHNLNEVEQACARVIIVSKGRIVADGSIDEVRARGGRVSYLVDIDAKQAVELGKNYRQSLQAPQSASQVEQALEDIDGVLSVSERPNLGDSYKFELKGTKDTDLRSEIYSLCVQKGWLLHSLERRLPSLDDVFKLLTRGDEAGARGRGKVAADVEDVLDDEEEFDDEDLDEDDLEDEDLEDEDDDEAEDDDDEAEDDDVDDEAEEDDEEEK